MDEVESISIAITLPEETAENIGILARIRGISVDKAVAQAINYLLDTIVDDYAQILHDQHGYNGGKGNHEFTFSDVLDKAQEELQRFIDTAQNIPEEQQAERLPEEVKKFRNLPHKLAIEEIFEDAFEKRVKQSLRDALSKRKLQRAQSHESLSGKVGKTRVIMNEETMKKFKIWKANRKETP